MRKSKDEQLFHVEPKVRRYKEPSQRTTLIWGDGNTANGVAPGYPNDIIPPGGFIVLDNEFSFNDRDRSVIAFDGRDKIYSTTELVLSKVAGFVDRFTVQTVKTNIYDTDVYGNYYIVPFGEDISQELKEMFLNIQVYLYKPRKMELW